MVTAGNTDERIDLRRGDELLDSSRPDDPRNWGVAPVSIPMRVVAAQAASPHPPRHRNSACFRRVGTPHP